jgi:hypothetical protein
MPSFFAALSSDWLMPMLQKEARKGRRDEQKNPASKISKAGRMARGRNRCRQSGCPGFDSSCRNFFLWILRLASPAGPVMSLGCRQYFSRSNSWPSFLALSVELERVSSHRLP